MDLIGYITLKDASDRSGKSVEALKKQCQEGRIRGAVKQGNSWLVPSSEVVVTPSPADDAALNLLLVLAERQSGSMNGTFYVSGAIISGKILSKDDYVERIHQNLKNIITFGGELASQKEEYQQKWESILDNYFDSYLPLSNDDDLIHFIHLDDVRVFSNGIEAPRTGEILRLKVAAINGFSFGRLIDS